MIRNAAISVWVNLAARAGGIGPEAARCRRRAMDAWRSGERCRRAFGGGGAFGALASLRSRMASAAAWASSSDSAPAAYAFQSSADRWSSWDVRAAAMARVNWSVNIESAFRAVTRRRAVDSGKAGARRKKALASIQNFGKDRVVRQDHSRLCRTPARLPRRVLCFWISKWFSAAGDVPAELPISCDLRRFVQSENGRYYCALGRSKAHHRIRTPQSARS